MDKTLAILVSNNAVDSSKTEEILFKIKPEIYVLLLSGWSFMFP